MVRLSITEIARLQTDKSEVHRNSAKRVQNSGNRARNSGSFFEFGVAWGATGKCFSDPTWIRMHLGECFGSTPTGGALSLPSSEHGGIQEVVEQRRYPHILAIQLSSTAEKLQVYSFFYLN